MSSESITTPAKTETRYRAEIDGLRTLAIVPVVLFHSGISSLFAGGFVGVDVFFVISGYLITSILMRDMTAGRYSILDFYERRLRRILPALFFVQAVALLVAWFLLFPPAMANFSKSLAAVTLFYSNILFWRSSGYFDTANELNPLLHTWSLAVEEQYYIFFPPLLFFLVRYLRAHVSRILILIGTASFFLAVFLVQSKPSAAFYLLPPRGWEILAGALLALHPTWTPQRPLYREIAAWTGLALILVPVFVYDAGTPFPSAYTLAPILGAMLIIQCATPATAAGRLLGSKPMVGIGLISYSAYLWHQPLFAITRLYLVSRIPSALLWLLIVAPFGLGYLSWRYVEAPFRNKRQVSRPAVFVFSLVGSIVFLAIGLAGVATKGFAFRTDPALLRVLAAGNETRVRPDCAAGSTKPCSLGAQGEPSLALLGDSHAEVLLEPLDQAFRPRGWNMLAWYRWACAPIEGFLPFERRNANASRQLISCPAFNRQVKAQVAADPRLQVLIVAARWTLYLDAERFDNGEGGVEPGEPFLTATASNPRDDLSPDDRKKALTEAIRTTIRGYLDGGRKVVLVYPIPEAGWDVPEKLARRMQSEGLSSNPQITTRYARFLERNQSAFAALDGLGEHPNLLRVRPDQVLCDTYSKGRCVASRDGMPLYRDNNHLSAAGGQLVAEEIARKIAASGFQK